MSIELSWMPRAAIAVWLSVIFTLYLAPSREKYEAADMLAAALLHHYLKGEDFFKGEAFARGGRVL